MREEIKRFGGELEFADAEIKTSTYMARRRFLEILKERKEYTLENLLRFFNSDSLPDSFRSNENFICSLDYHFLNNLKNSTSFRLDWQSYSIKPEITQTPVVFYFDYLSKNKDRLNKFAAESKKHYEEYKMDGMEKYIYRAAIEKIIPNWNDLSRDKEAVNLCKSLVEWAKKYNLNENWILDFALLNLRELKVEIDMSEPLELIRDNYYFLQYEIDQLKRTARNESILTNIWSSISIDPFDFYMKPELAPVFVFNKFGVDITDQWMPVYTLKADFAKRVEEKFLLQFRERIAVIYGSIRAVDDLIASSSEVRKISNLFKKALAKYYPIVLNAQPKGLVKTPDKKISDEHFEWLLDFQITQPIEKTYEDIARENGIDGKKVRSKTKDVSELIKLSLRPATRTGRPIGIVETAKRRREKKIEVRE